jgi:D-alanyl-D-alanine endopeptidase (penicillin-binding protein 7)
MRKILIPLLIAMLFTSNASAAKGHKAIKGNKAHSTFSAKSYLIADSTGQILRELDGTTIRPIASISKLMVAVLATEQDLDEHLEIPSIRTVQSRIPINARSMQRRGLLELALIRSDNFAAQILCLNIENCIDRMNERSAELGMLNTHFNEPTGLDSGNVSTAQDLLKLLLVAVNNPVISEISSMPDSRLDFDGKMVKFKNTNPLTSKFNIILSKTGFTNVAGGCLVMILNSSVGQRIMILLGSKNAKTRIPDMERLIKEL